jgi:hypothetical protein
MPTLTRFDNEHRRDSHDAEGHSRNPHAIPIADATLPLEFSPGLRGVFLEPDRESDALLGAINTLRSQQKARDEQFNQDQDYEKRFHSGRAELQFCFLKSLIPP